MSDIKHRTVKHLENTISYEQQRMNTAKLRIEAANDELLRREQKKGKYNMTIDLNELNPKDTVHFRCGGSAVIEKVNFECMCGIELFFEIYGSCVFEEDGTTGNRDIGKPDFLDIISITKNEK